LKGALSIYFDGVRMLATRIYILQEELKTLCKVLFKKVVVYSCFDEKVVRGNKLL
jgi:hypothetical protein